MRAIYLLFVDGAGAATPLVEARVRACLRSLHGDDHELRIHEVDADPEAAARHRVIATPLLVRQLPLPVRRLLGVPASAEALAALLRDDAADEGPWQAERPARAIG